MAYPRLIKRMKYYLSTVLSLLLVSPTSLMALDTAGIFASNMVLQRGMDVPIWGAAIPNAKVTVSFGGQTVSGSANAEGKWKLVLKPLEASAEGRKLSIKSGDKEMVLENVLIGEVWLGSGQSNMAGRAASYAAKDPTLAALIAKDIPTLRLYDRGAWHSAGPETSKLHSAILLAFGERLHRELKVPVGLFFGAVGGTPSGAWIPEETFASSEKIKAVVEAFSKSYDPERAMKLYQAKLAKWEEQAAQAKAKEEKVRGRKPKPPVDPGQSSRGPVGGLFSKFIRPHAGFAMRGVLWDQGESGTAVLGLDQHTCMSELIRGWRELWGQGEFPFLFVQKPSGLGNGFTKENPITRESENFAALPDIAKVDGGGAARFLYTRLMLDNSNAWMVPACDLGPMVHPLNKWGYGNRAAEVAAQKVYQNGVQAFGPIYKSHEVSGNTVTVTFSEVGKGLVAQHSDVLQGFAIAGKDRKWHWAKAEIAGNNTVTLSSGAVPEPTMVKFGYSAKRHWANLFNKDGLPALTFISE